MSFPPEFLRGILADITRPDYLRARITDTLRILFILFLAWIATRVVKRITQGLRTYAVQMMAKRTNGAPHDFQQIEAHKRAATLAGLAGRTLSFIIWAFAIVMILSKIGFDVTPILAGASVAGLAISLGAQNIFKDAIGGVFILLDDQIRIGDAVSINDTGGVVEEINFRTTLVRGENGALHIFSNGNIQKLTNNSRGFSFAVFEFSIDHRQTPEEAIQAIRSVAEEVVAEPDFAPFVLDKPEIYGVDRITDQGFVLKGRIKTIPGKQWPIARELNRRVKERFAQTGIQHPRPLTDVHFPQPPYAKDDLKQLIREVLAEPGAKV